MHTNGYHTHMHNHCKHDFIKYCEHCDVCFCTKCGREWGQKVVYEYRYEPYIWTYSGVPYTVTWRGGNDYSLTTSNGTAVTNKDVIKAFNMSVKNLSGTSHHVHS
jgi:hypothetical protein